MAFEIQRCVARTWSIGVAVLLFACAGCLPAPCNRVESRALTAADSTSRNIAAAMPIDTLILKWSATGDGLRDFEYPRTLLFDGSRRLWLSDAASNRVVAFDSSGVVLSVVESNLFSYPYLAGTVGDSVFAFSPGRQRVHLIAPGEVTDILETPSPPKSGLLQYAHVSSDGRIFVKLLGDEFDGYLSSLNRLGRELWRHRLGGPSWTHAGNLRTWGDTLLSLRGYQPAIDIVRDGTLDSLRLRGFDSPMLSRTRLFAEGQIDQPPLLTASAAAFENELFVLNMRPGWLRIDVYDRSGMLRAVLTQPDPGFNKQFYPTDIAVFGGQTETHIAVSFVEPEARVEYYIWQRLN